MGTVIEIRCEGYSKSNADCIDRYVDADFAYSFDDRKSIFDALQKLEALHRELGWVKTRRCGWLCSECKSIYPVVSERVTPTPEDTP